MPYMHRSPINRRKLATQQDSGCLDICLQSAGKSWRVKCKCESDPVFHVSADLNESLLRSERLKRKIIELFCSVEKLEVINLLFCPQHLPQMSSHANMSHKTYEI